MRFGVLCIRAYWARFGLRFESLPCPDVTLFLYSAIVYRRGKIVGQKFNVYR